MLRALFLTILLWLLEFSHATPVADAVPSSLLSSSNNSSACKDIDNCRTVRGIIWGCLSTIFLCTYVSYHPDVHEYRLGWLGNMATAISSMIVAVLVPEFVIVKAASDKTKVLESKIKFEGVLQRSVKFWTTNQALI